jgi:hypothetical protein
VTIILKDSRKKHLVILPYKNINYFYTTLRLSTGHSSIIKTTNCNFIIQVNFMYCNWKSAHVHVHANSMYVAHLGHDLLCTGLLAPNTEDNGQCFGDMWSVSMVLACPLLVGGFEQGTESLKNMLTGTWEDNVISVYADNGVWESYQTSQVRCKGNKGVLIDEYWCVLQHGEC